MLFECNGRNPHTESPFFYQAIEQADKWVRRTAGTGFALSRLPGATQLFDDCYGLTRII
jgi:hypothetical protein